MRQNIVTYYQSAFLQIACLLLILVCQGCYTHQKVSRDITASLKKHGIRYPYIRETFFEADRDVVYSLLLRHLRQRGAIILCSDLETGILSWKEMGNAFVSLDPVTIELVTEELGNLRKKKVPGLVFCTAVLLKTQKGTWLSLYSKARDLGVGVESFSDGTFERQIISSIQKRLDQIGSGEVRSPKLGEGAGKMNVSHDVGHFIPGFTDLSHIKDEDVIHKGYHRDYDIPASRFWNACLMVVSQYDGVLDLQGAGMKIVFMRRIILPGDREQRITQSVDVIMVVFVEAVSKDNCVLHAARIDENNLQPYPVPFERDIGGNDAFSVDLNLPKQEQASAVVLADLLAQVEMQMYYNERWGTKILRPAESP